MASYESTQVASVQFEDFDDKAVFETTSREAASIHCKNFVVEFGPQRARVARDVKREELGALLSEKREADYPIRWVNIWNTSEQKDIIQQLGTKYDFSVRLQSLMMYATDLKRKNAASPRAEDTAASKKHDQDGQVDLEKGSADGSEKDSRPSETSLRLEGKEYELYSLVKNAVNYTSVDQTDKAVCIGAHWLHQRPDVPDRHSETWSKLMPPKHWLWLAICNDNTVLSFHESPTYEHTPKGMSRAQWENDQLRSMRSNTLDVLLQLSTCGFKMFDGRPLSQSSVRETLSRLAARRPGARQNPSDMIDCGSGYSSCGQEGASNLFYYLFEDYAAASPLKVAGKLLDEMTPRVLQKAKRKSQAKSSDREIIPGLHNLSKELRQLKHLFESYKLLIDKIMGTEKSDTFAMGTRMNSMSEAIYGSDVDAAAETPRVVLTKSARHRFDRLQDRINGLMLSTIDGHLEEISALTQTYFNLTQQKDSEATARLNRSATLLAKLGVFFLPISFMTSYFSVQITELSQSWTAKSYWYSFAVIASLSFLCLFFFGRLLMFFSDRLDDWSEVIANWCRRAVEAVGFKVRGGPDDDDDEDSKGSENEGADEKSHSPP